MLLLPTTDQGYKLLHDGVVALAQVEANGIRIDRDYLDATLDDMKARIAALTTRLLEHKVGKAWHKRFGQATNLAARDQLGKVLFEDMGYKCESRTDSGKYSTDETDLEKLNIGFVKGYLQLEKLKKARGTYLRGIQRELDANGYIHPVFNLHTVVTYRGSCEAPNFQNIPIRNPKIGKIIRPCVIARPGCVLVENDFKGVEVSVAACYHKDPVMIEYITDPSKDMHRDMAMQLYIIPAKVWKKMEKKVSKPIRHAAKNKFVFPQFYGDWFKTCAVNLWEEIDRSQLKHPNGVDSLRDWLKEQGIDRLGTFDPESEENDDGEGTFINHVREAEEDFWNVRFKVYTEWKRQWFKDYIKRGVFSSYTGFLYQGNMSRNEAINYAVQGSAFHCLLWSLIRIQRELRRRGMRTKIIAQIHDSIIADVHISELDDYLEIVRRVTERDILEEYKWLIVPLSIECEISPIGTTWHDKREVTINRDNGTYSVEGFNGSARDLLKFWEGKGTV